MSLRGQLADELVRLAELREATEAEAPEPVQRFIVEAIDRAAREIENAAAMAEDHQPPTALAVELGRAERDVATHEQLLRATAATLRQRRIIRGEGFAVIGAVS